MQMTDIMRNFIREHLEDDVLKIVLDASRYEGVDVRFASGQIAVRRRIRDKLPSWYANDRLIFPSALAAEQCSSEQTASYKQRLIGSGDAVVDLTGGLGVDAYFLSRKARGVTYVERNGDCCEAARHNMKELGADNVRVLNVDAVALIAGNARSHTGSESVCASLPAASVYYIDPARRGAGNRRLFALQDCEPDLTEIWPALRKRPEKIIVKLSPMLDISLLLSQLPDVREVHVVSVRNECKEVLVVAGDDAFPDGSMRRPENVSGERMNGKGKPGVKVCCVNFTSSGGEQDFQFDRDEEETAAVSFAENVGRYLYEPNSSVLKAGAYRTVSARYGLKKLHVSSHLYTSETCAPSFAGRIFEVKGVYKFDRRLCRELSAQIPKANISVRNFPLSVDELRRRVRILDGGEAYLFATTLSDGQKVLIDCRKVNLQ
ncbi:MAG: SAM-dependent methyltransferase [Tannerella sp.]|nr:SAM-dependent methyltransferase [Tannerella sp.]